NNWRATGWSISTTAPGTVTCVDHTNHDAAGTFSETFSITAPTTPGTYNAYFIAYQNDICTQGASSTFTLSNGVVVDATAPGTASVTTPANGSAFSPVTVFVSFSGSAADNVGGAGLNANSTTFTLQRPDLQYWNGGTWQVASFNLATTHVSTTSNAVAAWTSN